MEVYEAGVREAERLAETVTDILPDVAFLDVTNAPRFDLGTLAAKIENRDGALTPSRKLVACELSVACNRDVIGDLSSMPTSGAKIPA